MTDWRGLCAELVAAWDSWVQRADVIVNGNINAVDATDRMVEAANEARASLAQPAPEGPSDEELRDLWSWSAAQDQGPWPTQQHCFARAVLARWGRPAIEPEERWYPSFADWLEREMPEGTVIGDPLWWASKIATYLQRFGRPAVEPVPVAERLPEPKDCNALGYCWWYDHRESAWIECDVPYGQRCAYRHWLPHHALPVPTPHLRTETPPPPPTCP